MVDTSLRPLKLGEEKRKKKKKPQDENIMSTSATQGGHNQHVPRCRIQTRVFLAALTSPNDYCSVMAANAAGMQDRTTAAAALPCQR